jgi:hypothetical protein
MLRLAVSVVVGVPVGEDPWVEEGVPVAVLEEVFDGEAVGVFEGDVVGVQVRLGVTLGVREGVPVRLGLREGVPVRVAVRVGDTLREPV